MKNFTHIFAITEYDYPVALCFSIIDALEYDSYDYFIEVFNKDGDLIASYHCFDNYVKKSDIF